MGGIAEMFSTNRFKPRTSVYGIPPGFLGGFGAQRLFAGDLGRRCVRGKDGGPIGPGHTLM